MKFSILKKYYWPVVSQSYMLSQAEQLRVEYLAVVLLQLTVGLFSLPITSCLFP